MAEDEVIEENLLQKLSHGIKQHTSIEQQNLLGKFVSFPSEFDGLKNMLEKRDPPSENHDWLSVRRENLYYLNNLMTEWQMITRKNSSYSFNEAYRSYENIKKSLKKMKKELTGEESSARGDTKRSVSVYQEPSRRIEVFRWSSRHPPRIVHGLDDKAMSMERELVLRNKDAPFKTFGVLGVAGIGKTTLCQTVFGRKKVKEEFFPRIWVCLSKQPEGHDGDGKDIVVRILKCLGIEDEVIAVAGNGSDGLRRLIFLLRLQLIGKRYLIVMDDAWNDDKFFEKLTEKDETQVEQLAYGLPKGYGGTVILSSMSEALAKKMIGEEAMMEIMKPITNEICDKIFKDTVTGYAGDDDEKDFPDYLKPLTGEILKTCAGLPLAAKLLGQIAREKEDPVTERERSSSEKLKGANAPVAVAAAFKVMSNN